MKNQIKRFSAFLLVTVMIVTLCACSKVDKDYGSESETSSKTNTSRSDKYKDIEIPQISSDDTVMSKYLDISLYDVENYADIYLGKDFKYTIQYCGEEFKLPSNYKSMTENGWKLVNNTITAESIILAGNKNTYEFSNDQGKLLLCTFHNSGTSSVTLAECKIVKLEIKENVYETGNDNYCEFNVCGITNGSSINQIIENLGEPSHFYGVSEDLYYLDYFLNKKDKRDRITIYVNPADDCLISIAVSKYN